MFPLVFFSFSKQNIIEWTHTQGKTSFSSKSKISLIKNLSIINHLKVFA
jgi:hypothetical protein